jgi:DNA-binding NarL/FixJ family response regulator
MASVSHVKTLRETVEVINTMIIRLQELKAANLSLLSELEPLELPGGAPQPERIYLSPRELNIIRLVGQGKSNIEIARELKLKISYVKNIVSRLYDKLEINDRGGLVLYAIRAGIVTVNPTRQITEEVEHN